MEAHHTSVPLQQSQFYSSLSSAPGQPVSPSSEEGLHYDYVDYATTAPQQHLPLSYRGFSERSPALNYDGPYFSAYGEPSTSPVSSTSTAHTHAYTFGMATAGPSSSQGQPSQVGGTVLRGNIHPTPVQVCQWASAPPYATRGPVMPSSSAAGSMYHKIPGDGTPLVRTPTALHPTPAAMAILLNTTYQYTGEAPSTPDTSLSYGNESKTEEVDAYHPETGFAENGTVAQASISELPSREKRHGCWMCHKSFDRPSTLRKHLLVHTGEKAFKCDTCGRRFGVASNLNRHVRKCVLKPVNTKGVSASPTNSNRGKRGRDSSPASSVGTIRQEDNEEKGKEPKPKRRRRAPSPSNWIPHSLQGFNLKPEEATKAVPVPLPPVLPSKTEERNSWDENMDVTPYHPRGWKNRLPGPGLGLGRELGNLDLAGSGGFVLGRVSVF